MTMSLRLVLISSGVLFAAAAAFACSDDTTPTPAASNDAGSSPTSDGGSGTDSSTPAADTGPAALNGCRTFADRSADDAKRTIQWDATLFEKEERCMQIKKGQSVTFIGTDGGAPASFGTHPIQPHGGNSANPIAGYDAGTGEIVFPEAGTFGFICEVHSSMTGAILVTE